MAYVAQRRGTANPVDSATDASVVYHAAHAQAALANRWKPTGFATLAVIGSFVGVSLVAYGFRRRSA
jgi:hypothetical protein